MSLLSAPESPPFSLNIRPDWGIVMEQTDAHADAGPLLYLVRKTKSSPNEEELRASENRKIECAKAHFGPSLGVDYKVVPNADKLP